MMSRVLVVRGWSSEHSNPTWGSSHNEMVEMIALRYQVRDEAFWPHQHNNITEEDISLAFHVIMM
jgi:hypothetical protein